MKIWRLPVCMAGLLGLLFGLTGCDLFSLQSEAQSLEQVEAFIGAQLPADASDVYHETGGFQDTIIWLRFDAAPDAVEGYLTELGFEEALTSGGAGLFSPSAPKTVNWWVAEDAADQPEFIGAAYANYPVNRHYQVLVDRSDAERWRVYLIVFNT